MGSDIFQSFLMGGVECSAHRTNEGKRLDPITATRHCSFAEDDERHCCNGLWDYPDQKGSREIYEPLPGEIKRAMNSFQKAVVV